MTPRTRRVAPVTQGQEPAKSSPQPPLISLGADAAYLLCSIVESSHDAIISKTLDGTITSWNAAAERIFGYRAPEAIGRSITMIIPPERMDEESRILAEICRGERIRPVETVRVRKDGRRIDVSIAVSPI